MPRIKAAIPPDFAMLARLIAPPLADAPAAPRGGENEAGWQALLSLAERHRVVPALAAAAAGLFRPAPEPVASRLSALAGQAAFAELALAATTREIVAVLAQRGIACIVLKGVPLSMMIHGRLGMRTSRDIDLLVAPRDAPCALETLGKLGFRARDPRFCLAARMRRYKDVELFHDGRRQIVELHWRLFDNPHLLPFDDRTTPARAVLTSGEPCNVLPQRPNLLYLASHGAQHGWSRLKWLADWAALLAPLGTRGIAAFHDGVEWAEGRRSVAQGLLLCGTLFGWPVPDSVIRDAGRDWRIRALVRIALHVLTGGGEREIEDISFATTRKNISHYLLLSSPRYLWNELIFDLNDVSGLPEGSRWRRWGAAGRLAGWIGRAGRAHG